MIKFYNFFFSNFYLENGTLYKWGSNVHCGIGCNEKMRESGGKVIEDIAKALWGTSTLFLALVSVWK